MDPLHPLVHRRDFGRVALLRVCYDLKRLISRHCHLLALTSPLVDGDTDGNCN
jgi:hypothetical protein